MADDVAQAMRELAEAIEMCSSPVHYAVTVGEERYQADKQRALEEQRRPLPRRDGP